MGMKTTSRWSTATIRYCHPAKPEHGRQIRDAPRVVKDKGKYFMWYSAYGTEQAIGMAKSDDGVTG